MRAPLVVSAVAAVAMFAPPTAARAECAMPSPALFPQGDRVPPNPVLYHFAPKWIEASPLRAVGADGVTIPLTITDASDSTADLRVTRVQVHARSRSFTITGGTYDVPRTFHIDETYRPVPLGTFLAPGDSEWISEAWTCSHTLGRRITARSEGVVAAEVIWPEGGSTIVPPNERAFWTAMMGGEIDPAELSIFLGHPNCLTDTVAADRARTPVEQLTIRVHYANGQFGYIFGKTPPLPDDDWCQVIDPESLAPRPTVAAAPRDRRWIIAGAGGIGALVTIALVLLVRRRRAVAVP
jgi:hypothetical protein